mgnify:CR=1 FL=1
MHDVIIRGGTIIDGSGAPGYLGDVAIVYASMPGVAGTLNEMLAVKLPAEDGLRRAGDAMRLHLPPQRCLLFDAAGQALPRTFAAPA